MLSKHWSVWAPGMLTSGSNKGKVWGGTVCLLVHWWTSMEMIITMCARHQMVLCNISCVVHSYNYCITNAYLIGTRPKRAVCSSKSPQPSRTPRGSKFLFSSETVLYWSFEEYSSISRMYTHSDMGQRCVFVCCSADESCNWLSELQTSFLDITHAEIHSTGTLSDTVMLNLICCSLRKRHKLMTENHFISKS